jgi:hypothetical protein
MECPKQPHKGPLGGRPRHPLHRPYDAAGGPVNGREAEKLWCHFDAAMCALIASEHF